MSSIAPPPGDQRRAWLGLSTLVRLRWGAAVAQSAVVGLAAAGGIHLPLVPLFTLIGLAAFSNLAAALLVRRDTGFGRAWTGALMTLDILVLTGLLGFTDGPHNPFSVLYLVHIALAALLLGPGWTWALALLSVAGYGGLFLAGQAFAGGDSHVGHRAYEIHIKGMWLAFTVAAGLIAHFGARLAQAIRRHESEAQALREQAERHRRLASLVTLAAGAAHELSTPLATIGVAAGEIEQAAAGIQGAEEVAEDARLIRRELERCRRILEGMSAEAGEPAGEALAPVTFADLAREVIEGLPAGAAGRITVAADASGARARLPRRAVARAVIGLVRNALDASRPEDLVSLGGGVASGRLRVVVRDQGTGMDPVLVSRIGEPFFSTKAPGRGLGLGVFLARTLAERLGGHLHVESEQGIGTSAMFDVPSDPTEARV